MSDRTHGGRVEYGDASEASLADALGDAMAGQAVMGVFVNGKTIEHTVAYQDPKSPRESIFEVSFTDGTALRIRGRFSAEIREKPTAEQVGFGVSLTTGEPNVIELDPGDVREE